MRLARLVSALCFVVATSAAAKPEEHPKAPDGFVEMYVAGVFSTGTGPAVFLRDEADSLIVPIWIGDSEALAISLRSERRQFRRPLTHDLLDRMVRELGGAVVKVHIDGLKGSTFVGTVFLRAGDKVAEIDARPSDSIALALGNRVPIYVAKAVVDRAGVKRDSLEKERGDEEKSPTEKSSTIHEL